MTEQKLAGRTIIMSGGSRGIGLAIALAAAREGANIALLAKTDKPDPRLPGTVHTAAAEIEEAGGKALAIVGDVRSEADVARAVGETADRFGGIDICVNNASAIALQGTAELSMKRFDLMQQVNIRGTYLLTSSALPHLVKADDARVITLSPPLNLSPRWLGAHPAYTLSKYGMTLLSLGWAEEFAEQGVAVSCLWPQTMIATAAVVNLLGGEEAAAKSRAPEIVADAAVELLTRPADAVTGQCFIDTDVLGGRDLAPYGGGDNPAPDLFID